MIQKKQSGTMKDEEQVTKNCLRSTVRYMQMTVVYLMRKGDIENMKKKPKMPKIKII